MTDVTVRDKRFCQIIFTLSVCAGRVYFQALLMLQKMSMATDDFQYDAVQQHIKHIIKHMRCRNGVSADSTVDDDGDGDGVA